MDIIEQSKKKMAQAIEHLKNELRGLRTGRASPALVESVVVEAYGTKMRLQELATISIPEPRQILITPFDGSNVHAIAKGIEAANLNLQPLVEGTLVRIKIPEMSAAVRSEMAKQAKRKCEETKVSIRNIRREANDELKKQKASSEITEDILKKHEKTIQELTDKSCKTADDITAEKEKEIQTI